MRIGLIGLGLAGQGIARRLLQHSHEVVGFDLRDDACALAEDCGVEVAEHPREIGANIPVILLSLFDSASRRALLFGEQDLVGALEPGAILVDTSTGRPSDLLEDHARLAPLGIRLVDAGLSGSSQVISEGRALALVGDTQEDAARYQEALAAFTKAQFFLGAPGRGLEAKLAVNMVFGLNRLVLAEALGLAAKAGLDLSLMLEILRAGETYSTAMDTKGPKMVSGVYEPVVARLAQHAKDVELIRELAQAYGASVPVTEAHAGLLKDLLDAGFGDFDNAAIFEAYRG